MKMRVMYSSSKGKFITYAEAIAQACGCLANDIPPAYPADKERLVLIGVSLKGGEPNDQVRRFCSELYPNRAANVALFIDGDPNSPGEAQLKQILRTAGTNVIDDTYYVKCGIFGKKISLEERQKIVDWARKMQNVVAEN